jgi:hypothetical protein
MIIDVLSKETLSEIKSTNPERILKTIEKIRESGNSFILPVLIDLLHDTDHQDIKKSILNLLSELKDNESVHVIVAAIRNEKYANECKDLIACCWQNGLSYIEYLPVFVDIVISDRFLNAFEAFTVIENMYGKIEDHVIAGEMLKIKDAVKNAEEQKLPLLNALLTIISDIPNEQEFTN